MPFARDYPGLHGHEYKRINSWFNGSAEVVEEQCLSGKGACGRIIRHQYGSTEARLSGRNGFTKIGAK